MTTITQLPIGNLTLEELVAHQISVIRELAEGKITPKEARVMDRAVGRRLKVIEEILRKL